MANRRSHGRIAVWGTALVLVAAVVALLVGSRSGEESRGSTSEAGHLREIERTRLHALVNGDTVTARRLIARDFRVINPAGAMSGREDYVDALESGVIDYRVFRPSSPITVRLSGDTAVLRFRANFDLTAGGDTRVTHQGWVTELYERREGDWQITWEQATAIPNDLDLFVQSIKPVS